MIRSTVTLLVCLVFIVFCSAAISADNNRFIQVNIVPHGSGVNDGRSAGPVSGGMDLPSPQGLFRQATGSSSAEFMQAGYGLKPVSKVSAPSLCPPGVANCAPAPDPVCILPKRFPRQWELAAQVFFARVKGTVQWPGMVLGQPTTQMDLNNDLGIPEHAYLMEFSAYYQLNPSWAVFYTVMPTSLSSVFTTTKTIVYGNTTYPAGTQLYSTWNNYYQRVGLQYTAINTCSARVSIYNSWLYDVQKNTLASGLCGGTCCGVDRTRNMVMSGIEFQKCIDNKCNGGALSCDTKAGVAWLDGAWGFDVQAGLRYAVPMGNNRWGYAKGGYRIINLYEDRPDLQMDSSLTGAFAELGIVF